MYNVFKHFSWDSAGKEKQISLMAVRSNFSNCSKIFSSYYTNGTANKKRSILQSKHIPKFGSCVHRRSSIINLGLRQIQCLADVSLSIPAAVTNTISIV